MSGPVRVPPPPEHPPSDAAARGVHRSIRALTILTLALASAPCVPAQFDRTSFTFHVYVDPVYGDDVVAALENPDAMAAAKPKPLQVHPAVPPAPFRYLQHAPYSFRTVTAVLTWLGNTGLRLPWTSPEDLVVEYVVIHCLPGLYGPRRPGLTAEYDALSGLPWNGEIFPLDIPGRVSIQGASALNTIFDARAYELEPPQSPAAAAIFRFFTSQAPGEEWQYSFIDSLTIRGARPAGSDYTGAGVLMLGEYPVLATISNCFIYNNTVGIGLVYESTVAEDPHAPRIVNNTIAWNEIGVWNGDANIEPPNVTTGTNTPILLNNIFDTASPALPAKYDYAAHIVGLSAFEGISAADREVTSKAGCVLGTTDFNAYESSAVPTRFNTGTSLALPEWPPTAPRIPAAGVGPICDLTPFTAPAATLGARPTQRGSIYLSDVFRDQGLQRSQHDFRLAPMAKQSTDAYVLNPLVNLGIDFGTSHTGTLTLQNPSRTLAASPGLPPPAFSNQAPEDVATLNAWDFDGEGAGNPRVASRVSFGDSDPCAGAIDLGADELGEVIVSGYLDSTTTFSRPHATVAANTASLDSRDRLYHFNAYPGPAATPGLYIRPQFNVAVDFRQTNLPGPGSRSEWFAQIATNPYGSALSNYTTGEFDTTKVTSANPTIRERLINMPPTGTTFPLFMRNLVCDLAPHLYHSITPAIGNPNAWPAYYPEHDFKHPSYPNIGRDIFQCNPWYNQPTQVGRPNDNDNHRVYYRLGTAVRLGMASPPVTVLPGDMPDNESYLFTNTAPMPPTSPHPVGLWDFYHFLYVYAVNSAGLGDTSLLPYGEIVPYVPGHGWQGIRANLELALPSSPAWGPFGNPINNLQSFLIVQNLGSGAPDLPMDPPLQGLQGGPSPQRSGALAPSIQLATHKAKLQELMQTLAKKP